MLSVEALKSELDVFKATPTQTSIEHGQCTWYKPLSALNDSSTVEYQIPGNGDSYIDLAHTMHYTRLSVTKEDGGALPEASVIALVNNAAHSMWRTCEVSFGSTLVTPAANNYSYRAYLETLLNYGGEAKSTHLTCAGWYKDAAGKMDVMGADNPGFMIRKTCVEKSIEIEFYTPLFCDVFNIPEYLLNGVDIKVCFAKNKDEFTLMLTETATLKGCKISHKEDGLNVRKVKLSPKILLAHEAALARSAAQYNFTRTEIKTKTLAAGTLSQSFDNIYLGPLPTRVIIGLVSNKAFKGSYADNPFNFKNYDLNHLAVYVDNDQVPSKALAPNVRKKFYVRENHTLFSGCGIHYGEDGNDISLTEYANGTTLYAFDLTPDISANNANHWNPIKQGQLRLDLGFASVLPEAVVCLVYAEFQSLIQIDKNRNVIIDY